MSDINGAFFVMFRLFPVIFGLFSLQLPSGLTRGSLLCYVRPFFSSVMFGLVPDISFQIPVSSTGMTVLFFLLSSSDKRSAFRGSLDCRVKPDNDKKKNKHEHDRGEETNTAMTIFFLLCLTCNIVASFYFKTVPLGKLKPRRNSPISIGFLPCR